MQWVERTHLIHATCWLLSGVCCVCVWWVLALSFPPRVVEAVRTNVTGRALASCSLEKEVLNLVGFLQDHKMRLMEEKGAVETKLAVATRSLEVQASLAKDLVRGLGVGGRGGGGRFLFYFFGGKCGGWCAVRWVCVGVGGGGVGTACVWGPVAHDFFRVLAYPLPHPTAPSPLHRIAILCAKVLCVCAAALLQSGGN